MFIKETINGVDVNISDINFLKIVQAGNATQQNKGEFLINLVSITTTLDGMSFSYEWWADYSNMQVLAFVTESISSQIQEFNF